MTARRRPQGQVATAYADWLRDREFQVGQCVRSGLGVRPESWWVHDAKRPDLAPNSLLDVYVHLRGGDYLELARDRLRFLIANGELEESELVAIREGSGAAYEWRTAVLDEGPDAA